MSPLLNTGGALGGALELRDPGGVVGTIAARSLLDARRRAERTSLAELRAMPRHRKRAFEAALRQGRAAARPRLIAEFKPKSPSRGELRPGARVEDFATLYGPRATAMSVLCDGPHFGGDHALLQRARARHRLPVLCKDFILSEYQLIEARARGADAALLMVSLLSPAALQELLVLARELGLDALVEVHDEDELQTALRSDARVIGVNSRDLRTLKIDLGRAEAMLRRVPRDRVRVAESGIGSQVEVERFSGLADAVLVGSTIMAASSPAAKLDELGYPSRTLIKICGLRDPAVVEACDAAGADLIGLNFVSGRRRAIGTDAATELLRQRGDCQAVGVFLDAPPTEVQRVAVELELPWVQLHGHETVAEAAQLAKSFRVIKALPYDRSADASEFSRHVDLCLIDGRQPGSGQRWEGALPAGVPCLLAGGLHPGNVRAAIAAQRPLGVDTASGVEVDGQASAARVHQFCMAVRQADAARHSEPVASVNQEGP